MPNLIWVGAEDLEYVSMGGATLTTASGYFRSGMGSRYGLECDGGAKMWESIKAYSETEFWWTGRCLSSAAANNGGGSKILMFLDTNLIERIRIVGLGTYDWKVEKVTAAGSATVLGNTFFWPVSTTPTILDKVDIHINNDVAGSIDIYINFIHVFAFIGDTTTDGVSTICRHRLGGTGFGRVVWSETFILDGDTRSQGLAGFSPVANGNTHNWDTGSPAAANVNELILDDSTLDASSSAGQIDQYTTGAVPTGTLDVIAYAISARMQKGASGPSKIALGVRTAGTDYWGSDNSLTVAWDNYQEIFATNPNTSAAWLRSQIGAASGFNIGAKSVT